MKLTTTDAGGKKVAVNWTLAPANCGETKAGGLSTGEYVYHAPNTIPDGATEVVASAMNAVNSAQTGKAIIRVVPAATVSVKAPAQSVNYGAKVDLEASVTAVDKRDLRWVIFPLGAGTMELPDPDDPTKAVYTAPAAKFTDARVVAYLANDQAAGLGLVVFTPIP